MWFSWTVPILTAWACLSDVVHAADRLKRSASVVTPARSKRMIGGTLSPHVPWQAMVYLGDSVLKDIYAGGALISDRWVLTAGRNLFVRKSRQDIQGKKPLIPKVYLGISHLMEANASSEVSVEKVVLHPLFQNQSDWDNDLALIQLKEPVVINDKVTPIPLPQTGQDLDTAGGSGVITGWGWGIYLTYAASLKYLVLPLANHSVCKAAYEKNVHTPSVDDNMFCTGNTGRYEENVCYGDRGAALAVTDAETGDIYAAGILSFDDVCHTHKYGVYMKISSYLPWIHKVMRGDTDQSFAARTEAMSKMYSWQP